MHPKTNLSLLVAALATVFASCACDPIGQKAEAPVCANSVPDTAAALYSVRGPAGVGSMTFCEAVVSGDKQAVLEFEATPDITTGFLTSVGMDREKFQRDEAGPAALRSTDTPLTMHFHDPANFTMAPHAVEPTVGQCLVDYVVVLEDLGPKEGVHMAMTCTT